MARKGGYGWIKGSPDELGEHSATKHEILKAYVRRYIEVVTQDYRQRALKLTIVDGFAGGNVYQHNGLIVPGSPSIFLETVRIVEAEIASQRVNGMHIDAEFYFVEQNKSAYNLLQDSIAAGPHASLVGSKIHIIRGDFVDHADAIIEKVRARGTSHRSIFLLDQYGWGRVPLPLVRRIMAELKNSEVFMTFAVDHLISYLTDKTSSTEAGRNLGLTDTLAAQFLELKGKGQRGMIQHVLYDFLRQAIGFQYVSPFFLHSIDSSRSLWFLHFSRNWRARDEIGQIHWKLASGLDHRGDPGFGPLGIRPERPLNLDQMRLDFDFDKAAKDRSARALALQIPDIVSKMERDAGPPSLLQIFDSYGGPTPVTLPMLQDFVSTLQLEGELYVLAENGRGRRKGVQIRPEDRLQLSRQGNLFKI